MNNKSLLYIAISLAAIAAVGVYVQNSQVLPLIDAKNVEMVQQGKPLYYIHCASCHGKNREGEVKEWRVRKNDGTFPAPPHDETGHTWHHNDKYLFDYTRLGGQKMVPDDYKSAMPGFGDKMTNSEIRAVLAFIKSRWPEAIQTRQQEMN
ncbi:Cytochrome c class I [Candidatus Terasakiella magnetica]|uniref:Cytochrome c class I n=1 Tax=Candidatus Terasakiella magnetica TaxID=1867952 RepID=A0A1C3RLY7_9PROT|nr:cytochrome c [Candidatus Terasakiella magnetica]SCA58295.1 Cytochrome c class I [Candidatus Terasakiella magnetica]